MPVFAGAEDRCGCGSGVSNGAGAALRSMCCLVYAVLNSRPIRLCRNSAERQLQRKRYEAALAEQQFNRVDPDDRLAAAELERRWEVALNEVRAAEALARQSPPQGIVQMTIGKEPNGKVIRLAGRLPEIWADRQTTHAQRKALLRCLVDKVVLDRGEHDVSRVRIVWRGGAVTELEVKMRVSAVTHLSKGARMTGACIETSPAQNCTTMRLLQYTTDTGHPITELRQPGLHHHSAAHPAACGRQAG